MVALSLNVSSLTFEFFDLIPYVPEFLVCDFCPYDSLRHVTSEVNVWEVHCQMKLLEDPQQHQCDCDDLKQECHLWVLWKKL